VIDYILELAKVEEKKVTPEELRQDPDAAPEGAAAEAKPKKKAAPKKKAEKAASEE
jgi:trigger factor